MAETMDVRASARYVPMSPQKVRLVLDMIRGLEAVEALDILQFTNKAASKPVAKLIRSAIASAEENYGIGRDELVVQEIYADKGPPRRWRRFGARGRFKPLLRRSSHITVVLREVQQAEQ
jgi:large subunit ribosomal protein L22